MMLQCRNFVQYSRHIEIRFSFHDATQMPSYDSAALLANEKFIRMRSKINMAELTCIYLKIFYIFLKIIFIICLFENNNLNKYCF